MLTSWLLLGTLVCGAGCELSHSFPSNSNSDNDTWGEIGIQRSPLRHKDQNFLLDRYPVGELPTDSANCRRPAKCIEVSNGTLCMGTKLPYPTTTLDLIPDLNAQENIQVLQNFQIALWLWGSCLLPLRYKRVVCILDRDRDRVLRKFTVACGTEINSSIWVARRSETVQQFIFQTNIFTL